MSYENKGSLTHTVVVSVDPDRTGNFVCDGTADDVQIQAAIDYVSSLGGGSVFIKRGTYNLDAAIQVPSNMLIEGEGEETILVSPLAVADYRGMIENDHFDEATVDEYIIIRDITLEGQLSSQVNTRPMGIAMKSCQHVVIEGVVCYNIKGDGVWFQGSARTCDDIKVRYTRHYTANYNGVTFSRMTNGLIDGCTVEDTDTAISAFGCQDVIIRGNIVKNNNNGTNNVGIGIEGSADYQCRNITIIDNISADQGGGIGVHHGNTISIIGNAVYNISSSAIEVRVDYADHDITIVGNNIYGAEFGIVLNNGYDHIVADNVVSNTTDAAIVANTNSSYCHISDNVIVDAGNKYIQVSGNHTTVCDNTCYDTTGSHWPRAIQVSQNGDYSAIFGNLVYNIDYPITIDANAENCRVFDNHGYTYVRMCDDNGTNTIFRTESYQFTEPVNGAITVTSPTGVNVDADTERALAWGQIPNEIQQIMRLKIWAVALGAPIGAGGQMHLEVTFNAGASNAAYNTAATSWNIANFDGEEADYVANDVVHWVIERGDVGNELDALAPGDSFEIFAIHEAGADPDGATNAVFRVVEVEYV